MAQIIQFPTFASREWRDYERTLEQILQGAGASAEMCAEIKAAMKSHVEKFSREREIAFNLRLPTALDLDQVQDIRDGVDAALSDLASAFQEVTSQMFFEICRLEVELYLSRESWSAHD